VDFVLIDASNGATTANGEKLLPEALTKAAAILEVYANRDVAAHWGGAHRVRAGTADAIQPGEVATVTHDVIPEAPSAIAYHDVNGVGVPTINDAITLSDSLFGVGNSWLVAMAHEIAETIADAACNIWRDDGQGTEYAQEACDAVEAQSYEVTTTAGDSGYVSNFLTPAFFTPGSLGPYDHMSTVGANDNAPPAPFVTPPGGNYQIERSSGTGEHQVQARYTPALGATLTVSLTVPFASSRAHTRLPKREHPSSRSYRRGLRVELTSPDVTKSP
jgi:hypothetical protein